jgi:ATP-binding cassette, subfamily B, bacterial
MHHGFRWYFRDTDEKPRVTWALLRRVLGYGRPYRRHIAGMLLLILLSTGLGLVNPLILRDLIDRTIPNGDLRRLAILSGLLLVVPLLNGMVGVTQRKLNAQVGEGVIYDLRTQLFAHLQRMSLRFFTNTKVGELMSRLNNDVIGAQNAISNTIVSILTNLAQATAVLVVLLTLEWRLTLVSVIVLPLLLLAARRLGNRLREIAQRQMEANARMNAMMNETLNIGGALLVKLFGRVPLEVDRFRNHAATVRDLGVRRSLYATTFFAIIGLISAVGSALVFSIGGYLVIEGAFTIGTIVAFGAYLTTLYSALQGLANAPVEFAASVVSFERVFEVIDLPLEIRDQPEAIELARIAGGIDFEEVTFKYEADPKNLLSEVRRFGMDSVTAALSGETQLATKEQRGSADGRSSSRGHESEQTDIDTPLEAEVPSSQARPNALDGVTFQAAPGELVALVGPSGAGKTTLTYLIPRLYDPTEGCIRLDGHDLRDVDLLSLSQQIGMVTQETYLFHDTIRTNLLYARLDATQEEIEAACQAANIHDFIVGLPDGYDTIVGERGYRLSGGEKQRLALARVILKDPRILVLDEATSHLDSESEALIQQALKHVMAGRTSIVIAHRLSTILAADQILVLDRGRIVERGTHAELLEMDGVYAGLYHTQFKRQPELQ